MLVLLDTSAAFDTINIDLLLNTLHQRFGIGGTAFDWFKSYLTGRSQRVAIGSSSSTATPVFHGVPQGSVLGPVMFNVYTTPTADICKKHQVHYHRFADDIQQSLDVVTSAETERQQNRVYGAAIIAQSTRARQPNLATFPTHTNINRHSQESGLFRRPTYATGPAGLELLFLSLLSSANDQQHSPSSHTRCVLRCEVLSLAALTTAMRYSVV